MENLVGFCFVSSLNFAFSDWLPSDLALKNFMGRNQHEMYKSITAGLSLASLEHSWVRSEKPTGKLLFVQSCSPNTATAKVIKSMLVKPSVKYKIIFVIKNVVEAHPALTPAQADEYTSQVAA